MYFNILSDKNFLYKKFSRRKFLFLLSTLPLLNSFNIKQSEFSSELEKLVHHNGTILLAEVKTSKLIAYSNLNKAFKAYTIGSLAKLITTTALLEKHLVNKDEVFYCKGKDKIAGKEIICWNAEGHGKMNLESAIAESCNIYFYKALQKISSQDIINYFKLYHLDYPELKNELDYKSNTFIPANGVKTDIGLGLSKNLLFTPLQMLSLSCSIARNGIYKPLWIKYDTKKEFKLKISDKTLSIIKDGMIASGKYGTAKEFDKNGFKVAAKTGSAPINNKKTHGWCIGYVPYDNPKIAFCIFIDEGTGFSDAVPVGVKALKLCRIPMNI